MIIPSKKIRRATPTAMILLPIGVGAGVPQWKIYAPWREMMLWRTCGVTTPAVRGSVVVQRGDDDVPPLAWEAPVPMRLDEAVAAGSMRVGPIIAHVHTEQASGRATVTAVCDGAVHRRWFPRQQREQVLLAMSALPWVAWLDRVLAIEEARGGSLVWGEPIRRPDLAVDLATLHDPRISARVWRGEGESHDRWTVDVGVEGERMEAVCVCGSEEEARIMATAWKYLRWEETLSVSPTPAEFQRRHI